MKLVLLAVPWVVACGTPSDPLVDDASRFDRTDGDDDEPRADDDDAAAPAAPTCTAIPGHVQGASSLNVRREATSSSAATGTVQQGDALAIYCRAQGDAVGGNTGWDYLGADRGYVADAYVEAPALPPCTPALLACGRADTPASPPPSGGDTPPSPLGSSPYVAIEGPDVQPQVQDFANDVCAITGACRISTYEGHDPSADLAIDILISDEYGELPADDNALGERVAEYALANQTPYHIEYVIFRQRINLGGGWEDMDDRGSITQNHFDHVHVTFEP